MEHARRGAGNGAAAVPPRALSVSVIIPTLNEAQTLPGCLASLADQGTHETVVVDGGSNDDTVIVAEAAGVRVLTVTPPRRARQMNAGATTSAADVLLFLGADSRLSDGAVRTISALFAGRPRLVGGSFALLLCDDAVPADHSTERRLRKMAAFSNAYCRRTRTLMCDRAVFVRRDAFEWLGGFRDLPVMEDVDLGRRLRDLGETIVLRAPAVASSARRFTGPGGWLTGARIVAACAAYYCGLPVDGPVRRLYQARGGRP